MPNVLGLNTPNMHLKSPLQEPLQAKTEGYHVARLVSMTVKVSLVVNVLSVEKDQNCASEASGAFCRPAGHSQALDHTLNAPLTL